MKLTLKYYFSILLTGLIFSGCLKTNDLYEGFTDLKPLADIPLSHLSTDSLTIYALPVASSASATIDTFVAVHLSDKDHVGDVTFQLGLGNTDSAFVKFMNDHPEYTLMPSSLYSFDSSVTIQNAGVLNTANFSVKFKTAALDADGNNLFLNNEYVLPIIIKDAGGYDIASNFRMIIMRVLAKNKYDGLYDVTGYFVHPSSPREISDEKSIATAGAIRCEAEHSDLYTSGYYFDFDVDASNKLTNYSPAGATPNGGFMTVDNPTGDPNYPGDPYVSSTYNNTYDPDGQIFWMHYGYDPTGSTNQNTYTREVYEKWVRE